MDPSRWTIYGSCLTLRAFPISIYEGGRFHCHRLVSSRLQRACHSGSIYSGSMQRDTVGIYRAHPEQHPGDFIASIMYFRKKLLYFPRES